MNTIIKNRFRLIVFCLFFLSLTFHFFSAISQSCTNTYPGGARNFSTLSAGSWSCSGGGAQFTTSGTYSENLQIGTAGSPIGNGDNLTFDFSFTLIGNIDLVTNGSNPTVTIPQGVTVVIRGNLTDAANKITYIVNGTLIITGTLSGVNNTSFGGTGLIAGTKLDVGNSSGCSGACPNLSFGECDDGNGGDPVCSNNTLSKIYVWNGSVDSDWQKQNNWTPVRNSLANTDQLFFENSGANKSITNIPTQTIGRIQVSGSSTYSFTPVSDGLTLTLTNLSEGNSFTIDNGSTLNQGSSSNSLAISLPTSGVASVGGTLNLIKGSFAINDATLILHTNPSPLSKTNGQLTIGSSGKLQFGINGASETTSSIVLPNDIFNGTSASFQSITMNRLNGATLNNQAITLSSGITFTSGNLNVPNSGTLIFATGANNPTLTESSSSRIVGYAETTQSISTGTFDFLGFNMTSGNNLGFITVKRRTGTPTTFNGVQSIASVWNITTGTAPSGRSINFKWLSDYDNGNTSTLPFRTYINDGAPAWSQLGSDAALSSTATLRVSAPVATTQFGGRDFTLTDNTRSLPIELIDFKASVTFEGISITWKTATEINNDYFEIQKMEESERSYYALAKIPGNGTTKTVNSYSFVDDKPAFGYNYYRLKQVDFDGTASYSKTIVVQYDSKDGNVRIYPNPADGSSIIRFANVPGESVISLYDRTGKLLVNAQYLRQNSIDLSEVQSLQAGVYIIRIASLKGISYEKLIVSK